MTAPLISTTTTAATGGSTWVLGPSLGTDFSIWNDAVNLFPQELATVRWDLPGHGASPAPSSPFSMADLATGVVRELDRIGIDRVRVAGVSLGGMVSLQLALDHPDRVDEVVMICSAPHIGNADLWNQRASQVLEHGTESLLEATPSRWFTETFCERFPATVERMLATLASVDDRGYAWCAQALRDADLRPRLGELRVPFAIIAGAADPIIPLDDARAAADAATDGELRVIPHTSHLAVVEAPSAVARALV